MSSIARSTAQPEPAVRGWVHSFESLGTVDGPGVRFIVFFQGCPLACQYCHNPDARAARTGMNLSAGEIVEQASRYRRYFRASGGGVTLSGGEPLLQPEFAAAILRLCRDQGIHTALDTSGFCALPRARPVLELCDLVLLDLKSSDPLIYRRVTAVSIEPTLATARLLSSIGKPVWIRFVLVPGLTDDPENVAGIARFISSELANVEKVQILPFHKLGEAKWDRLGIEYRLRATPEAAPEQVARATEIFRSFGLKVD
ncbi:MAG: pyruvate formate-lyase-activating protein [Oligoflexia bacterium]|nr:pyruvate formate-lyase-activating protein [Oligoflexia bacterium]